MTKQEFEERVGLEITDKMFDEVARDWLTCVDSKDDFCMAWLRKAVADLNKDNIELDAQLSSREDEMARLEKDVRAYKCQFAGLLNELAVLLDKQIMIIDPDNKQSMNFAEQIAILLDKRKMQIDPHV
jgi:hypothetical protein